MIAPPPAELANRARLDGHLLTLQASAWTWAFPGLALLVLIPVPSAAIGWAASQEPDGLALTMLMVLAAAGTSIAGVALIALSPSRARRSRVEIDLAHATIRTKGGTTIPFASVAALRLVEESVIGPFRIVGCDASGRAIVTLASAIKQTKRRQAITLTQYLGEAIAKPVELPTTSAPDPQKDRVAAMLCYLPIQGIFVIASVYFLFTAQSRPFVHFAARQCLWHTATTLVVLTVVLGTLGPLVAFTAGVAQIIAIVLLSVALVGFVVWNLWAHIKACIDAYHGRVWIMPWLRWRLASSAPRGF